MTERRIMHPTAKAVRVAGAFYLALVLGGPLRLINIPSTLFLYFHTTKRVLNDIREARRTLINHLAMLERTEGERA
jgi:hypothetical protein